MALSTGVSNTASPEKKKSSPLASILMYHSLMPALNVTKPEKPSLKGLTPARKKQQEKQAKKYTIENTFKALAMEWHAHKCKSWSEGYAESVLDALNKDIFPHVGKRPIADIRPLDMLQVLRIIEKRGALEKMRKVRQQLQSNISLCDCHWPGRN
ncbi:Putative prophage CPS-53 integrase [Budvicia aquatica]|uniref:Prophage CPS-53 integrase n=1 Tax=Budvicia aquatica TaxID=82979 RepID=A0A485A6Q4_9GAMM|nr:Putative prophage CPS-53 integrase [Budvicia aquatica]